MLSNSLKLQGGTVQFWPTTVGYNRRLRKKNKELDERLLKFRLEQERILKRKEKEEKERLLNLKLDRMQKEEPERYRQYVMMQNQNLVRQYRDGTSPLIPYH
jgi:hypothetical protein